MSTHVFKFDTYLYRGACETEVEVEVTYSVSTGVPARLHGDFPHPAEDGEVEILAVKGVEFTSRDEDNRLYDEACDRADSDLAEWHAEQEEYRAEYIREERMIRDFQTENV